MRNKQTGNPAMEYFDLTPTLGPNTPTWPSDPRCYFSPFKSIAQGNKSNVTKLTMSSHAGAHIDAPKHFIERGNSVDTLSLEVMIGPVRIIEVKTDQDIDADTLEQSLVGAKPERLLIKTRNSKLWSLPEFSADFIGLKADAAEYLIGSGVKLVGVDYLSIEAEHNTEEPVHHRLLSNDIVIIEGLNMSDVQPGEYELLCLPLKLEKLDGAPARVVVRSAV